jgi:hypothetical protein
LSKAGYGKYATQALSGSASAIANAATRSLVNGSNFGDNILAALPDVIGSTLGNMVADGLANAWQATANDEVVVTSNKGVTDAALPQDLRKDPRLRELADAVPGDLAARRSSYRDARGGYRRQNEPTCDCKPTARGRSYATCRNDRSKGPASPSKADCFSRAQSPES